jgi:hypothetical protein
MHGEELVKDRTFDISVLLQDRDASGQSTRAVKLRTQSTSAIGQGRASG